MTCGLFLILHLVLFVLAIDPGTSTECTETPVCEEPGRYMSLFYAKFYPLREIHQDKNYIYNFWSHDGGSIAQAWGRPKSLMLKCPNHELPKEIILTKFYARLSRQDKEMLDASSSGVFPTRSIEEKGILLKESRRILKTGKSIKVLNPL